LVADFLAPQVVESSSDGATDMFTDIAAGFLATQQEPASE
jgi:hypothetical protein